ncbi:MAG TPA: hypothetical protein VGH28_03225 [Polyangiaceae bacterium]|jgi:hypothetical protein
MFLRGFPFAIVLVAACGGATTRSAEPTAAGGAPGCREVVARYDRVDADLKTASAGLESKDIATVGNAFRDFERITSAAAADFGAMKPDAKLSSFVSDTARYSRTVQQASHDASAFVDRIAAANASSNQVLSGIKARSAAVGQRCATAKLTECPGVIDWIKNLPESPDAMDPYLAKGHAIDVHDAMLKDRFDKLLGDLDTVTRNAHDAKAANEGFQKIIGDIDLDKRGDVLDQRLHDLCGRPLPAKTHASR